SQQTLETNPKGRLQKLVLQRSSHLPRYRVLEQSGRNNDRIFLVGVFEHDALLGQGQASSIKEAGRLAARQALEGIYQSQPLTSDKGEKTPVSSNEADTSDPPQRD